MTRAYPIATTDNRSATLVARTGSSIAKIWNAYWQRRAMRVTVALLSALDDRTLRDIGVSRDEIGSVVYGRPADRTRCYEEVWASRRGARNGHAPGA